MRLYCEDYLFFWSTKQKVLQNPNCCPAVAYFYIHEHNTTFAFSHSRWIHDSKHLTANLG